MVLEENRNSYIYIYESELYENAELTNSMGHIQLCTVTKSVRINVFSVSVRVVSVTQVKTHSHLWPLLLSVVVYSLLERFILSIHFKLSKFFTSLYSFRKFFFCSRLHFPQFALVCMDKNERTEWFSDTFHYSLLETSIVVAALPFVL